MRCSITTIITITVITGIVGIVGIMDTSRDVIAIARVVTIIRGGKNTETGKRR